MSTNRSTRRRLGAVATIMVALPLLAVGVALAVKPKGSYTFVAPSGPKHPNVSFTTTQSGKKLVAFQAGPVLICKTSTCGGFGGLKAFTRSSVKVSAQGTFKVSGLILSVTNKKLGTQTVTGKFVSPTKAKGKVTTSNLTGFTPYHGGTEAYTAKGTPAGAAGTH